MNSATESPRSCEAVAWDDSQQDGAGLGTGAIKINHHQVADSHHSITPELANALATFGLDGQLNSPEDASIWEALFDGQFRLASRCDVCGRWLTASASKRVHRGPRCAAKAVLTP